jgi:putative ABC transport system permease protein
VIVDEIGAAEKLGHILPNGKTVPLDVGDVMELNDHRAVVVGICKNTRTFQSQPVVYTTYTRATTFAPHERKLLSFVLVKAKPGVDPNALCKTLEHATGQAAYTRDGFEQLTYDYFMKATGIPINFGIAVGLGFLVGTIIAGQTFYNFTLDNLRYFGALKAMGASNRQLLGMILMQALLVGAIGYGLGVGIASLMGWALRNTELSFRLPAPLLGASAGAVMLICILSALLSIRKVMRLEPAIVFKS